jgi:hypothetical protein
VKLALRVTPHGIPNISGSALIHRVTGFGISSNRFPLSLLAACKCNGAPHVQSTGRLRGTIGHVQSTLAAIARLISFPAAFEDFLTSFKSSASATEASAADALEGLNIDDDATSDEYDFMDDVEAQDGARNRQRRREGDPKKKYMEILQKVADRKESEVCIELDDLDAVGYVTASGEYAADQGTVRGESG